MVRTKILLISSFFAASAPAIAASSITATGGYIEIPKSWYFNASSETSKNIFDVTFDARSLSSVINVDMVNAGYAVELFTGFAKAKLTFFGDLDGNFIAGKMSAGQSVSFTRDTATYLNLSGGDFISNYSSAPATVTCNGPVQCSAGSGQLVAYGSAPHPSPATAIGPGLDVKSVRVVHTAQIVEPGPVLFAFTMNAKARLDYELETIDPFLSGDKKAAQEAANAARLAVDSLGDLMAKVEAYELAATTKILQADPTNQIALLSLVGQVAEQAAKTAIPAPYMGADYKQTSVALRDYVASIIALPIKPGKLKLATGALVTVATYRYETLQKIANDPPRPDFDVVQNFEPITVSSSERTAFGDDTALDAILDQINFYLATRASLDAGERYLGALAALDGAAASKQYEVLNASMKAADVLAARMGSSSDAFMKKLLSDDMLKTAVSQEELDEIRSILSSVDIGALVAALGGSTSEAELSEIYERISHGAYTGSFVEQSTYRRLLDGSFGREAGAWLQTSAVPEPTTWLMMLFGMGLAGSLLRRKTKARSFVG